ncbi:NAD(P)H-binding protein [Rhodococcus sp. NPDC058532]|uniref:NAD(P)H-binding protein n=1 Tax=Rhodococcus sp. NPDC058532 TaxID=3346540 RepID=UPI00366A39C3
MTILVTGATGSVGRLVIDHLVDRGATGVRALTTNPERAALPPGVEVALGYLRRPETMPRALEGVRKMYLAPAPETVRTVVAMARDAGVEHIVDLSGEPESWWGAVTLAVEASGIEWTHLWAGEFLENDLVWSDQIRRTGVVLDPYPEVVSAPIAMDDIARVAATVLLGEGHAGRTYRLTGPTAISRGQRIQDLGAAIGRPVSFLRVTPAEAVTVLRPVMGDNAAFYIDEAIASMVGAPQAATTTVADVTGQPATSHAAWAAAHADYFR